MEHVQFRRRRVPFFGWSSRTQPNEFANLPAVNWRSCICLLALGPFGACLVHTAACCGGCEILIGGLGSQSLSGAGPRPHWPVYHDCHSGTRDCICIHSGAQLAAISTSFEHEPDQAGRNHEISVCVNLSQAASEQHGAERSAILVRRYPSISDGCQCHAMPLPPSFYRNSSLRFPWQIRQFYK